MVLLCSIALILAFCIILIISKIVQEWQGEWEPFETYFDELPTKYKKIEPTMHVRRIEPLENRDYWEGQNNNG